MTILLMAVLLGAVAPLTMTVPPTMTVLAGAAALLTMTTV